MPATDKPIRLSGHALQQLAYRGATEAEVVEVIRTGTRGKAEGGRQDSRKDFVFETTWNGKHYKTRQVRPVFAEEASEIVVVTVYVYYF